MRTNIAIFTAAAAIGAVTVSVASAQAQTQVRQHSSACYNAHNTAYLSDSNFGISNTAASGYQSLVCAAPDTDTLPKTAYTIVNVEAWVTNASFPLQAMLCEDNWNNTGGACSSPTGTGSGAGHETVALGGSIASVWNASTANNFGYVFVNTGGGTRVAGIFYAK